MHDDTVIVEELITMWYKRVVFLFRYLPTLAGWERQDALVPHATGSIHFASTMAKVAYGSLSCMHKRFSGLMIISLTLHKPFSSYTRILSCLPTHLVYRSAQSRERGHYIDINLAWVGLPSHNIRTASKSSHASIANRSPYEFHMEPIHKCLLCNGTFLLCYCGIPNFHSTVW